MVNIIIDSIDDSDMTMIAATCFTDTMRFVT
jgi:hypothetical protein